LCPLSISTPFWVLSPLMIHFWELLIEWNKQDTKTPLGLLYLENKIAIYSHQPFVYQVVSWLAKHGKVFMMWSSVIGVSFGMFFNLYH
jgi:hypothetical protein